MEFVHEKDLQHFLMESEKIFRNLAENVHCGVYIADCQGALHYVNEAFVEILGYGSKQELLGLSLGRDIYPDVHERERFLKAMEKTGFVRNYEVTNKRKDGSVVTLLVTSHFIRNDSGVIIGVEGIVLDITDRRRLEEELLKEKEKLEQILSFNEKLSLIHRTDRLADFIVESVAQIMNVHRCSLMLLDEKRGELCIKAAKGLRESYIKSSRINLGEGISGSVAQGGAPLLVNNIEYDLRFGRGNRQGYAGRSFIVHPMKVGNRLLGVLNVADKDPGGKEAFSELDLRVLAVLIRQAAGALENVILVKELEYLANNDPLTNLTNYRGFIQRLEQEINRSQRSSSALSLMMIDIDDFKKYNDSFGHLEGDRLLHEVGRFLKENLRSFDTVCRYGGDEFVVILPGTSGESALQAAEKIKKVVEGLTFKQQVFLSIGVAEFQPSADRMDLISRADQALYEAKKQGKKQCRLFHK